MIILKTNNGIIIIYISILLEPKIMPIYPFTKFYITLQPIVEIFAKYLDFFNIFFSNSVIKLLRYNAINNYFINILDNKQLFIAKYTSSK